MDEGRPGRALLAALALMLAVATAARAEDTAPIARPADVAADEATTALVRGIVAAVAAGCHETTVGADAVPGVPAGDIAISAADDAGLTVAFGHGREQASLPCRWSRVRPIGLVVIARGLVREDAAGCVAVARAAIALGLGGEMDEPLTRLRVDDPRIAADIAGLRARIAEARAQAAAARDAASREQAEARRAQAQAKLVKKRIDQEGRELPQLPKITRAIAWYDDPRLFDAVFSAMQVLPKEHPFNEDISGRPVHPDSDRIIAAIGLDKSLQDSGGFAFTIVPSDQPRVPVVKYTYGGPADPIPIPFPPPISGLDPKGDVDAFLRTLQPNQDRHMLIIEPSGGFAYEFWSVYRRDEGYTAGSGVVWDLNAVDKRFPGGADAAGLPIFAGLIRYDEVARGMVAHALRCCIAHTRPEHIYPATTHTVGTGEFPWPAMGQRLRLKASVDISGFSAGTQAVLKGLKKYGMLVADNGALGYDLCTTQDPRLAFLHQELRRIKGSDLEVVVTTGPSEGPREPDVVNAKTKAKAGAAAR